MVLVSEEENENTDKRENLQPIKKTTNETYNDLIGLVQKTPGCESADNNDI